jgi:hypothetical protein
MLVRGDTNQGGDFAYLFVRLLFIISHAVSSRQSDTPKYQFSMIVRFITWVRFIRLVRGYTNQCGGG